MLELLGLSQCVRWLRILTLEHISPASGRLSAKNVSCLVENAVHAVRLQIGSCKKGSSRPTVPQKRDISFSNIYLFSVVFNSCKNGVF